MHKYQQTMEKANTRTRKKKRTGRLNNNRTSNLLDRSVISMSHEPGIIHGVASERIGREAIEMGIVRTPSHELLFDLRLHVLPRRHTAGFETTALFT